MRLRLFRFVRDKGRRLRVRYIRRAGRVLRREGRLRLLTLIFFKQSIDNGRQFHKKDMSMSEHKSLRTLKVGQRASIAEIDADGEMGRRIRDMGLVPGVQVEVIGRAPLQDPVALRLLGFTLTLRNNEADFIRVTSVSS